MNIVIVGGAGFIGVSAAAAFVRSGDHVKVFDSNRRLERAGGMLAAVEPVKIDGLSKRDVARHLEGSDVLVHLAWSSQPADSMTGMIEDASENIVGSLELFNGAAVAGVQKIIFASSGGTVYGNTDRLPITEDHPLNPVSAYGVSKAAVERYLQLVAYHQKLSGLSLRIGNPYGPYQHAGVPIGVIAHFIRRIRDGEPLKIYGDGSIVRDYIWVDDVADALVAAAHSHIASGEYNIGSGAGLSITEVAEKLQILAGVEVEREYVAHRSFDAQRVILSTAKFELATGWHPRIPIGEGLERMLIVGNGIDRRVSG